MKRVNNEPGIEMRCNISKLVENLKDSIDSVERDEIAVLNLHLNSKKKQVMLQNNTSFN